jgi:hypothetical protein
MEDTNLNRYVSVASYIIIRVRNYPIEMIV